MLYYMPQDAQPSLASMSLLSKFPLSARLTKRSQPLLSNNDEKMIQIETGGAHIATTLDIHTQDVTFPVQMPVPSMAPSQI